MNTFFNKNNKDNLSLIKRKAKQEIELNRNEIELRSVFCDLKDHKPKKMDLEGIKQKTKEVAESITNLQRRIEILEGKHDFLDYCHSELSARNQKIKNQLSLLSEKEKNLEHLFFYIIQTFCPSIQIIENLLPDENAPQDQIVQFNKNEFVNQIIKKIQNYWNRNSTNGNNSNSNSNSTMPSFIDIQDNAKDSNWANLSKLIEFISSKKTPSNSEIQNEIKYFAQIKDFQLKYLNDLDNNGTNGNCNTNAKPLKVVSIEDEDDDNKNNTDYNHKSSERNHSDHSFNSFSRRKTERNDDKPDFNDDLFSKSKDYLNDSIGYSPNRSAIHLGNINLENDSDIL